MSERPAVTPGERDVTADELEAQLERAGLSPRRFSNAPGDTYPRHDHPTHKILFCAEGSITFRTDAGDLAMSAGDRLDLPPGSGHSATVGDDGVTCVEAHGTGPHDLP
jgi:quercetin dioxygenase-like cupin family protein